MLDKTKRYLVVGLGLLGGKYALELTKAGFHVDGKDKEYLTITATSSYTAGYFVTKLLDGLQAWVGSEELPDTNVNLKANGSWTKLGVVVKTDPDTKQSYMAIAFQIKNPNYGK